MSLDIIVVGAGIAGLSAALHLREQLGAQVQLIELEPLVASHSSGRNAGIWLPADGEATTPPLARRSAELLDELAPGWFTPQPALYLCAEDSGLDPHAVTGRAAGCHVTRLTPGATHAELPWWSPSERRFGLHVDGAGVIDIHAVSEGMIRALRASGVTLRLGVQVRELMLRGDRISGVRLGSGDILNAEQVVVASGAWAKRLGETAGASLPLAPMRRHLVHLAGPAPAEGLTIWDLSAPLYFRPESGGLLASPCDETLSEPCLPAPEADALDLLAERLETVAPTLASRGVRRSWACLRTFAPDRELVVGPDPRVRGLHWLVGLGGRGMNVGAAVGEVLAAGLAGRTHALQAVLDPARLIPAS